jgi:aminomethyltransferase
MPIQYTGIVAEHQAVRSLAGLFDVSHMGRLVVSGERALEVVNHLITNDLERIEDSRALYTCACNESGGILDDLIVYRYDPQRLLIVCNASNLQKIGRVVSEACKGKAEFNDVSADTGLIALQGPKALDVLEATMESSPESIARPFSFTETRVAGAPCTVARTGYTGEDGVEIMCRSSDAATVWRALLASEASSVTACGLGARDTLRLEARLSLYGNDIDEGTNPLEAGLGWVVKFDKPDFEGKAALLRIKEQGATRKLVGFELRSRGSARPGYPLVNQDGERIGTCTSGCPSPTLGKAIGLGYLTPDHAAIGTKIFVDCRGKTLAAEVVKTPFYKRATSG